jgi:NAD-dependent deacetylase
MRSEKDQFHEQVVTIKNDIQVGDLAPDGGQYRPHIVWFEEDVPMLEEAIEIVEKADIFVIIGTSLQVYPAAGLINYAPRNIQRFIIDKNIPAIAAELRVQPIQAVASEGVAKLIELIT